MMDYRILFVYRDSSTREVYASTDADVLAHISNELQKTLHSPVHDHSVTVHVTNVALQN